MSVRKKILSGFISIFIIAMILATVGFVSTNMLTDSASELHLQQANSADIGAILNAHYIWRQSLTEAVLFESEFTGSLDHNNCALGKWLNGGTVASVTDPEILSLLNSVQTPHAFIHNEAKQIVELISAGRTPEAKELFHTSVLPATAEVISLLTGMEERYGVLVDELSSGIKALGMRTTTIIAILVVISIAASVVLAALITSSIMRPLRRITNIAESIATGDLDVEVSYHVNDQIGLLAASFQHLIDATRTQIQAAEALASGDLSIDIGVRSERDAMNLALRKMIENLNNMFRDVHAAATQMAIGSKQVANSSQTLAQGSTEQASAVEELSASIGEISEKTKYNANIAREAAKLSELIKSNAEKGSTQMDHMMQAVEEISTASHEIEKVMKVIDDIAFQTNILALNAAVEAARAGQHGKGFAVVAEEVRSLAAKSAEAAKNTGGLIENSVSKASLGLSIANETASSLNEIVEGINKSAEIVIEIAHSSDEQAGAIAQINTGIEQVAQVVHETSATAESSASSSEQMNAQSHVLNQLVEQFKLRSHDARSLQAPTNKY